MLKTRRFERILVIKRIHDLITSIRSKRRIFNIYATLVLKSFIYSIIVEFNLFLDDLSFDRTIFISQGILLQFNSSMLKSLLHLLFILVSIK